MSFQYTSGQLLHIFNTALHRPPDCKLAAVLDASIKECCQDLLIYTALPKNIWTLYNQTLYLADAPDVQIQICVCAFAGCCTFGEDGCRYCGEMYKYFLPPDDFIMFENEVEDELDARTECEKDLDEIDERLRYRE